MSDERRLRTAVVMLGLVGAMSLGPAALLWAQSPQSLSAAPPPLYVIGPGDVLQVFVWKEPQLTRDVTVRFDGRITLPLLGDVLAEGHTPPDLAGALSRQFTRFIEAPVVTLAVAQANRMKVYVVGQVAQPGAFPLAGRLTLVQVVALAGGFREYAKTDRILILSDEPGQRAPITVSYKRLESEKDLKQNVVLKPGDTVVVP